MKHPRYYADEGARSHTEDVEVELVPRDFAPPAPPLHLSWDGGWHPTPRRQLFFLAGELEGETGDGERRRHNPGSAVLLEDTTGTGHPARVVGNDDGLAAVVQVPD